MAIAPSDIQVRLSGGASNTNPLASLGGAMSSTAVTDATDNNLFPDVTGSEAIAGSSDYACLYFRNGHASLDLSSAKAYIDLQTASADDDIYIGLDPAGVGDGSATGVAATIPNKNTAPSGVTFSQPMTYDGGLTIGTLPYGQAIAIWVRWTTSAGAPPLAAIAARIALRGISPA